MDLQWDLAELDRLKEKMNQVWSITNLIFFIDLGYLKMYN